MNIFRRRIQLKKNISHLKYDNDSIGVFSSFLSLSVQHGFSWGEKSENMSENYDNYKLTEHRVHDFLKELNISSKNKIITIYPHDNPHNDSNIMEITPEILKRAENQAGEILVGSNAIYTCLGNVVLVVKPADCAISIIYFQSNQKKYVGLIHSSAQEVDKQTPLKTIDILKEKYGVDPSKIIIGITPAISKDFYFVDKDSLNLGNWDGFHKEKDGKIFLDITGNTISQFLKAGVPMENIEAYQVDTFTSATIGKTFSHNLSMSTGLPEGRYIVAVKLIS